MQPPVPLERLHRPAASDDARRRTRGSHERVPCVDVGPVGGGGELRDDALLYRAEWSDLIAARRDDAKDSRNQENPVVAGSRKHDAGSGHHDRSDTQDGAAAQPVGHCGQEEAEQHVTDKRQAEEETDQAFRVAQRAQVWDQR
ncbi:uncharacterized protein PgNI_08725 [Pyricularia grisea]|uniref:Uncharacterized protein n=1 Tax=Pyricularia grisea TaxID=148305 RepID=A0A6P8AW06_PYRGI|nr:uncharacterized protein PgNI_08725 [Pyricularia grisea]TLD06375.1 hypothetical protein PgNI_08725 [Pyricularia grisea]